MPRSFSQWTNRARPDLRLFAVPPISADEPEAPSSSQPAGEGEGEAAVVDELEDLISSMLDTGSPSLMPGSSPKMGPRLDYPLPPTQDLATAAFVNHMTAQAQAPARLLDHSLPPQHQQPHVPLQQQSQNWQAPQQQQHQPPQQHQQQQPQQSPFHAPQADQQQQQSAASAGAPLPPSDFEWHPCETCLVNTDVHGNPLTELRLPARETAGLNVRIEVQPALLYWADRRQWMWHKKWTLPTVTVRVERAAGAPAVAPSIPASQQSDRFYVHVTAGTLDPAGEGLEHQGLGGGDNRMLVQLGPQGTAEASFTRLLFQQTSFNVGNRPFHLVVTVFAVPPRPYNATAGPNGVSGIPMPVVGGAPLPGSAESTTALAPLVCYCSSPVRVDARKRSKGERPEASNDDVRLVNRQRPTAAAQQAASAPNNGGGGQQSLGGNNNGGGYGSHGQNAQSYGNHGGNASTGLGMIVDNGSRFSARQLCDATCDALLELRPDGVVVEIMTSTAFGYMPAQLLGRSIFTVCHADEHQGLVQTMQAVLIAANTGGALGAGGSGHQGGRSIRCLHRVIVGLGGFETAEVVTIDSILSVPNMGLGAPQTLLLSSRRALPVAADPSSLFRFQVFPWPENRG